MTAVENRRGEDVSVQTQGDVPTHILLVDDRPENLLAMEAMLEDLGQRIVRAYNGEEALKAVLHQEFSVILLDVQMPGMDGFEIARLIKERRKSQHIPIIFVTAIDRDMTKAFKGYAVGAVDYMFKPIEPEILRAKVLTFVEIFRKTKQAEAQAAIIEASNHELAAQLAEIARLNTELAATNEHL